MQLFDPLNWEPRGETPLIKQPPPNLKRPDRYCCNTNLEISIFFHKKEADEVLTRLLKRFLCN